MTDTEVKPAIVMIVAEVSLAAALKAIRLSNGRVRKAVQHAKEIRMEKKNNDEKLK